MGQIEVPFVRRKVPNLEITRLASCVCSLTSGCITERNGQNDHTHTNSHTQTHTLKHIHTGSMTFYKNNKASLWVTGIGKWKPFWLSETNSLPYYIPGQRRSYTRILHPCPGRTGWCDFEQITNILHNSFFPTPPPQMTVMSLRLIKWFPLPPNLPCQASSFMQRWLKPS